MSIRLHHIGIGVMLVAMCSSNLGAVPDIGGHWVFSSQAAIGHDLAAITLEDTGTGIRGRYFGILGQDRPLSGTRSGEALRLVLSGEWPPDGIPIEVTIAGSLSEDS